MRMRTNHDCPHCGALQRDFWDHHWGSADEVETCCGACGGDVVITREITAKYWVTRPKARAKAAR